MTQKINVQFKGEKTKTETKENILIFTLYPQFIIELFESCPGETGQCFFISL